MIVTSSGIKNGVIEDKYGKRGSLNEHGIPTYSIPLRFENPPENVVSYAVVIEDKDAIPVSGGFSWIHWVVANITKNELKENESITSNDFIQGVNSWISLQGGEKSLDICCYYGGMAPPNAPHIYEIHVYALDTIVALEKGFYLNELHRKMDNHIIEEFTLKGEYRN